MKIQSEEVGVLSEIKIMPCLDIRYGRVVKGIQFADITDAGDPIESAGAYSAAGADELTMLDIAATAENRGIMLDVIRNVAKVTTIPFTVGGGIHDIASAGAVLEAGADKISISSAAFKNPKIIGEIISEFGTDCLTVAIDVTQNTSQPSGYEVWIDGGRTATGVDAIEWAKQVGGYGVTTILPTSKSTDGIRSGYDLPLIRKMKDATGVAIIASGGAGKLEHFLEAVNAGATILLAASVFHFNIIGIQELKNYLRKNLS